jgi:predicted membrane channel-forming protein YqfA (hemolysin III family)
MRRDIMKLFKTMSPKEIQHSKKGIELGFYILLVLLGINIISYIFNNTSPFSSQFIFVTGIAAAYGYELILNMVKSDKRKSS